jgi:hypothetical protein
MLVFVSVAPRVTKSGGNTMDIEQIREFLVEEGFRPEPTEFTSGKGLTFKYEGGLYWVMLEDQQPVYAPNYYVRIVFPNFYPVSGNAAELKVVAHDATLTVKVAKVMVYENGVSAASELFVPDEQTFRALFMPALIAAQFVATNFSERAAKAKAASAA